MRPSESRKEKNIPVSNRKHIFMVSHDNSLLLNFDFASEAEVHGF